ncbi:DUF6712 family protein [Algoriphagus marincola]|uniref:DUF6712 family protein n=1 Tax=Algoriphagus marincola TaxID=264027 RepID=UPI00047DF1BD|nr:DUF6712 family protein [Algoriphagus marincola]
MMLINKSGNGAEELQQLTSSFYSNNDFERARTLWILEENQMIKLVGGDLMARALNHYKSEAFQKENPSAEEAKNDKLVQLLQIPIAYRTTLRYYQLNTVSHETSGRKVKIDRTNESMAWEWMIDKDDDAQRRMAHETTDMLIDWLESNKIAEWMGSENRKASRELFVNSIAIFQKAYPMVDHSQSFFYTVVPFLREIQNHVLKKALGTHYTPLLQRWTSGETESGSGSAGGGIPSLDEEQEEFYDSLLRYVQTVQPLLAMVIAVKRLSVQVMPEGVVQHFRSMVQSRNASQIPLKDILDLHIKNLNDDARELLDDIKVFIRSADPDAGVYTVLPENKEENKFFRT